LVQGGCLIEFTISGICPASELKHLRSRGGEDGSGGKADPIVVGEACKEDFPDATLDERGRLWSSFTIIAGFSQEVMVALAHDV